MFLPEQNLALGDDATRVNLSFRDDENTLENIDNQKVIKKVTHEIQTTEDPLRGMTKTEDLGKATAKWQYFTYKREPRRLMKNISGFEPVPQKVDSFGMSTNKYGDEIFLTDYVVKKSIVNFPALVMKEMEAGFTRLEVRNKFAAMVNPVRWRYTPDWKTFGVTTGTIPLPYSRIIAFITNKDSEYAQGAVGASISMAMPNIDVWQKVIRKFTDYNVPPSMVPRCPLSPNMMEILSRTPEFKNRENIYRYLGDEKMASFVWKNIRWVRVTPEVLPGPFYAGKKIQTPTAAEVAKLTAVPKADIRDRNYSPVGIAPITDSTNSNGAVNLTLTADNHEVLPMWIPMNITKVTNKMFDRYKVIKIPLFRDVPILFRERSLGGCREQNVLQLNLIVPKV